METVYQKGNGFYNPILEDSRPNQLFRDYIEPNLHHLKLKENQALDTLEIYVANRFGIAPSVPYSEQYKKNKNELIKNDLLIKLKNLMKPYICGDSDSFDYGDCPEYKLANIFLNSKIGLLTILHGDIGAGKSTLLKFVINKLLPKILVDGFVVIFIDALETIRRTDISQLTADDLHEAILQSIESQLIEPFIEVEDLFFTQLATVDSMVWNNMKDHGFAVEVGIFNKILRKGKNEQFQDEILNFDRKLQDSKKRLQYNLVRLKFLKDLSLSTKFDLPFNIKKFNKIFLVFDNIDQTSQKTKELTIEIGKYFAKIIQTPVIITLRSSEFNRIVIAFDKALSEYGNIENISLHPPDLGFILEKRFKTYIEATQEKKLLYKNIFYKPRQAMHEVTTKLANLLTEENSKELLLVINDGNIRETGNIFLSLLGSSGRALPLKRLIHELFNEKSDKPFIKDRLPFDYLIEMLALNRKTLYKSKTSLLANLYCSNVIGAGGANNLIKSRILEYLNTMRENGTYEFYVEDIIQHLVDLFAYDKKLIFRALEQLVEDQILWSREGKDMTDDFSSSNWTKTKVTRVQLKTPGIVYNKLKNYLWYICCVKEDCLVPKDVASVISFENYDQKRNHRERYKKEVEHTLHFIDYIIKADLEKLSYMWANCKEDWRKLYINHYGEKTLNQGIIISIRNYFRNKEDYIVNAIGGKKEYSKILKWIENSGRKAKEEVKCYLTS